MDHLDVQKSMAVNEKESSEILFIKIIKIIEIIEIMFADIIKHHKEKKKQLQGENGG